MSATAPSDVAPDPRTGTGRRSRAAWWGLGVTVALMVLAMVVPAVTGWNPHVHSFPPLHAAWDPRIGVGTVPALILAVLAARSAFPLAERLTWGRLLLAAYAAGVAWMVALAFVDGVGGLRDPLNHHYEYLNPARDVDDVGRMLREYVDRIPFSAGDRRWPPHPAGHPAGALLFFVGLVRLGLGSGLASGIVVTLIAASTAVAVLVTMRVLGAERPARLAAPFLVFGPAAIWQSVSADGMFAAFAAWGFAALAVASVRRSLAWSVLAGLLLGWCVMLSYGLPLLGVLALVVLWLGGSWRPLVPAALAALAVVLAFAALGFVWWEALPVLHQRYWEGTARVRPATYWVWGDLAALGFSAGPLAGAGLAHALTRRSVTRDARVVRGLAAAGLAMVLAADASLMSKAEVERIWLPFVPWLLVSCALLPERWRRIGLVAQVSLALVVQHLLFTGW